MIRPSPAARRCAGFVTPDDVQALATPVLAHRMVLDTKAKYGGMRNQTIIEEAMQKIPVPR